MSDQCNIYAVVKPVGFAPHITLRVTDPMDYGKAVDLWSKLDKILLADYQPRIEASRLPVDYFCIRSTDDPNWPSSAPRSRVRYSDLPGYRLCIVRELNGENNA